MLPLLILILLPHLSCKAPGPLAADRNRDELFGPAQDNLIVVDAILIVDAPLPAVLLRRTVAPGLTYEAEATALTGARVSITSGAEVFDYRPDPEAGGRYLAPDDAPAVAPDRTYELRVQTAEGAEVSDATLTPPRTDIGELVLLDDDQETELRRLKLFSEIGDEVYQAPENQLEFTRGRLKVHLQQDGAAASYQFAASNLESFSPLLFANDWFDESDFDRVETSPLLGVEEDGVIFLPWSGIYYAGRYKVKLFAVDRNWFDLVRTDNVDSERGRGEAGQGFQRPLFRIENGIGLFASAAVDSIGFFVRPRGSPKCSGCECWSCEEPAQE